MEINVFQRNKRMLQLYGCGVWKLNKPRDLQVVFMQLLQIELKADGTRQSRAVRLIWNLNARYKLKVMSSMRNKTTTTTTPTTTGYCTPPLSSNREERQLWEHDWLDNKMTYSYLYSDLTFTNILTVKFQQAQID